MKKIGKVQFHKLGRFGYFYLDGELSNAAVGDWLVCESGDYVDMGRLISIMGDRLPDENGSILRIARESDFEKRDSNRALANDFLDTAKLEADKLCLSMKMIDVAITLDRTHATFFFTANSRVDFRALVRSLAHKLHCRIEMYQIRAREETKLMGGIGVCGQRVCCDRFLNDFKHISVAMAKNQNLNVSVKGIKGICGKLLCCLSYEEEIYREFKKSVPKIGTVIKNDFIQGKVVFISPLKKQLTIKCQNNSYVDVDPYTLEPIKKDIAEFPSVDTTLSENFSKNSDIDEKKGFADSLDNNDNKTTTAQKPKNKRNKRKRKKRGKKRR